MGDVEIGEDLGEQLKGQVADNVELEGSCGSECMQGAPFVGSQFGEQGFAGVLPTVFSRQGAKCFDELGCVHDDVLEKGEGRDFSDAMIQRLSVSAVQRFSDPAVQRFSVSACPAAPALAVSEGESLTETG